MTNPAMESSWLEALVAKSLAADTGTNKKRPKQEIISNSQPQQQQAKKLKQESRNPPAPPPAPPPPAPSASDAARDDLLSMFPPSAGKISKSKPPSKPSSSASSSSSQGSKKGSVEIVSIASITEAPVSAPQKAAKAKAVGPNALRNAHSESIPSNAVSRGGPPATKLSKKASELWFRKAGYGPQLFDAYFRGQSIIPAKDFPAFKASLERPLPLAFRIRSADSCATSPSHASDLKAIKRRLDSLISEKLVTPLASDDSGLIFVCRKDVHKQSLSLDGSFRSHPISAVLSDGVKAGVLCRQELVSMLPVLLLGAASGDRVLDVCASPGSKTMQLLERVAAGGGGGGGVVVANDVHPMRLEAMRDALERHERTSAERQCLLATCHPGQLFPFPKAPFPGSRAIGFDKVLADVPCSGDGTIRKDSTVLPRWNPNVSNGLHPLQLQIAWRSLQLLKVGGRMLYSTCALNPVEDEAVVAALLRLADGAAELEPWPADLLPGFRRRPGVSDWKVADFVEEGADDGEDVQLRWHKSMADATKARMQHSVESLWPRADNARYNLDRCSRILHSDNDSGGFFVAVIKKTGPFGAGDGRATKGMKGKGKDSSSGGSEEQQLMEPLSARCMEKVCEQFKGIISRSTASYTLRRKGDDNTKVYVFPPEIKCFDEDGGVDEDSPGRIKVNFGGALLLRKASGDTDYEVVDDDLLARVAKCAGDSK